MSNSPTERTRLTPWLLAVAVWALLVLAFAAQLVLAGSWTWGDAFLSALRDWLPWAFVGPLVFWLAGQFPIEHGKWPLNLPVLVAGCLLALFVCDSVGSWLPTPPPPALSSREPGRANLPAGPDPRQRGPGRFVETNRGPMAGETFGGPNSQPPFRREGQSQPGGPFRGQQDQFDPRRREGFDPKGQQFRPDPERQFGERPQRPQPGQFNQAPGGEPFDQRGQTQRGFQNPGGPPFDRTFQPQRDWPPPGPALLAAPLLRARFHVPVYWVIVCLAHALAHHRRSEERQRRAVQLEARLSEARLQALQMQLQPHFLFNTLNAIATLVHKDPRAADEMITNLGELLRAALDGSAQQEVPLRRELDFLTRYLDIQQARFGDRLRVEQELDAAALDARVPTLILQPLVENAIRHGIEPRAQAGVVGISARCEGGKLRLAVRDSGAGLGAAKLTSEREGIGLANTRARLEALYGAEARLLLRNGAEGGFSVELEIPFRTTDDPPTAKPSHTA
jgi:hypothetical protein